MAVICSQATSEASFLVSPGSFPTASPMISRRPHYRVLCPPVGQECLLGPTLRVLFNRLNTLQYVLEIESRVLLHKIGTWSRSMHGRNLG